MEEKLLWEGLPYYPISQFYKKLFGQKVYKVSVSTSETCPNREGLRGMKTCSFCDEWGSAAYPDKQHLPLKEQVLRVKRNIQERFHARKFLVYFQAYTSTFGRSEKLRQQFEEVTCFKDVCGFVVGTRPDCLSEKVFELWNEFIERGYFVAVELGVQSFDNQQLLWMRRGHTAEKSEQALKRIQKHCPQVNVGIHLMFGLKGETEEQMISTAQKVSSLPVHNVKLHNLHVLKNTPLEEEYLKGEFKPLSREGYARRVSVFLQHLNPQVAVHRLTAVASRHDELVAPKWAAWKMGNYQFVLDYMRKVGAYQGQYYQRLNQNEVQYGV